MEETLRVGQVARMAGVSVRTLHHYDAIGLLTPDVRSSNGYRQYGRAQVARLQEVLFFKELGFPLDAVKAIVETPGYDRRAALEQHRALLERRTERMLAMLDAVDRAITAETKGVGMTNEEMLDVFGDFDPAEHAAEAEERWGGTNAYRESVTRTAAYTKGDWTTIRREADAINAGFLELMARGEHADGEVAAALVDRHRAHISKWFYDCTPEIHRGLGEMYLADPRFRENIDKAGERLAAFQSAAIAARYGD
jgi:DNA-binding transcriptional MerR regulator